MANSLMITNALRKFTNDHTLPMSKLSREIFFFIITMTCLLYYNWNTFKEQVVFPIKVCYVPGEFNFLQNQFITLSKSM